MVQGTRPRPPVGRRPVSPIMPGHMNLRASVQSPVVRTRKIDMPLRSRSLLLTVVFAMAGTLLIRVDSASAQASSAGLQMLQGLTPEQRDAISRQLGGVGRGNLGGTQGTLSSRQEQAEEEQLNFMLQQQRDLLMDAQKQRAELERLSPFLQGEDWVIITIDSSPLPAVTETTSPVASLGNFRPGAGGSPDSTASAAALALAARATKGSSSADVTAGGYPASRAEGGMIREERGMIREEERGMTREERGMTRGEGGMIDLIRSKNPYQLSREGVLTLPGFAPIPLAGLTEQLATLRLGAEPALRDLYIRVTKLPLNKVGPTALKPFGYDLFDRQISTFAPATNVPVPADYVVGPGDELDVQLYGKENTDLQLVVGRDGRVSFPELGPISVGGQTFNSVKAQLEARVQRQMLGVRASVTMGDTRTIRVFVLGDARQPGSYTISGLGTISSALFAAGGVKTVGSLRNIQLKRRGQPGRPPDPYDLPDPGGTTDHSKPPPDYETLNFPIGAHGHLL